MSIPLLKSVLSLIVILSTLFAAFTGLEIFGRKDRKYDIHRLKKVHLINGIVYLLLFIFITYFCLSYIINSKSELSSRGTVHGLFVIIVLILLGLKISFVRVYRSYYGQVPVIGIFIVLLTFGIVGVSGGYYFIVTDFGTDREAFDKIWAYKYKSTKEAIELREIAIVVKKDRESIGIGRDLFDEKCSFCHDAYSTDTIVGPGLKGILKNPDLPMSRRPSTPENVVKQLRHPFNRMPSFAYLSEEEITNLIAFLNTL